MRELQDQFFGKPIDEMEDYSEYAVKAVKTWAYSASWNEYYDLVQFLADFSAIKGAGHPYDQVRLHGEAFLSLCNAVLEKEKSAYRFVSGELTQLTDETEIAAIESALAVPDKFSGSRSHLSKALRLYSDRDAPDYRNSIKEAISAIEAAFYVINGQKHNSLAKAISAAEKGGFGIHSALKQGILSIYGWTSDESGVRHALMNEDANVGEVEAKLMLIVCSGFLNFLISQRG